MLRFLHPSVLTLVTACAASSPAPKPDAHRTDAHQTSDTHRGDAQVPDDTCSLLPPECFEGYGWDDDGCPDPPPPIIVFSREAHQIDARGVQAIAAAAAEAPRLVARAQLVIWGEKQSDEDVEPRAGDLRDERARAVRDALVRHGVPLQRIRTQRRLGTAAAVITVEGCG